MLIILTTIVSLIISVIVINCMVISIMEIFGDVVIANFNVIVSLVMIGFSDFSYYFGFENHCGNIILVDNIIIDRRGCVSGNFVIGVKVVILLMLLIIVIFVNFD